MKLLIFVIMLIFILRLKKNITYLLKTMTLIYLISVL